MKQETDSNSDIVADQLVEIEREQGLRPSKR